jgi:hypothetical protein
MPIAHSGIIASDFNSHHQFWGCDNNNPNGDTLNEWDERKNIALVFDIKVKGIFRSGRWQRDYNPDLYFITNDHRGYTIPISREVFNDFPHSQHRPVFVNIGLQIPVVKSLLKPRWYFNKANWNRFSKQFDDCIRWISPEAKNYDRFTGLMIGIAKKHIPRRFRKECLPSWSQESEDIYNEYQEMNDNLVADKLLSSLSKTRREKWIKTVENINFKKSS